MVRLPVASPMRDEAGSSVSCFLASLVHPQSLIPDFLFAERAGRDDHGFTNVTDMLPSVMPASGFPLVAYAYLLPIGGRGGAVVRSWSQGAEGRSAPGICRGPTFLSIRSPRKCAAL